MLTNKKISRLVSFFTLFCFGILAGCKHEIPVQPEPSNPGTGTGNNSGNGGNNTPCDPTKVYFQRDVLPILVSNCLFSGCHNANDRQKGVVLDSYNSVMNSDADVEPFDASGSKLYRRITETDPRKRMPYNRPALTAAQITTIRTWINQGATNETCTTVTCDSVNVTYTSTIKPIVESNCIGCHSGASPAGGLNYTSHAVLQSVALNGKLNAAISHTGPFPMPKGGNKLSDCNIALIRKWIKGGALNN